MFNIIGCENTQAIWVNVLLLHDSMPRKVELEEIMLAIIAKVLRLLLR